MKNTKLSKYLSIQIVAVWLVFGLAANAQNHLKGQRFFEGYLGTVDGFRLQLPIRAKSKIDQKPKVRRLLIN